MKTAIDSKSFCCVVGFGRAHRADGPHVVAANEARRVWLCAPWKWELCPWNVERGGSNDRRLWSLGFPAAAEKMGAAPGCPCPAASSKSTAQNITAGQRFGMCVGCMFQSGQVRPAQCARALNPRAPVCASHSILWPEAMHWSADNHLNL